LPWTESRSREEWLAEVRRRGERMRRRRRMAFSALGALVLIVPVAALASFTGGDPDPALEVTAAGPGPARAADGGAPPTIVVTTSLEAQPPGPTIVPEAGAEPGSTPPVEPQPVTTEVHRRASSVNGVPSEDPVIRPTPTTTVAAGRPDDGNSSSPVQPPPTNVTPPTTDPTLTTCPTSGVDVTVSMGKAAYAPGERVTWSSTLTNVSGTTCLVSGRAFFHVEDSAGKRVGNFAYTADFQLPVRAEPGKSITNSLSWDQKDCSSGACLQVPAGTYTVVAAWTEAAPYIGEGTFQIGG
jgi:hypothetical protein